MTADAAELRRYGRTGLEVSALCVGTSSWGPVRTGETAEGRDGRVLGLAAAVLDGRTGLNFIDTSNEYGQSQSEGLIGRALAASGGLPAGYVLQTKLDRDPLTGDFSAERMRRSFEESLERLGVPRVQNLFLHDPENIGFAASMAPGGPVDALIAIRDEGLAGSIGISGGPVGMLQAFVETDVFDTLITHNRFTLVDRSASALLDAAAQRDIGVCNAAPYGGGALTGDARFAGRYGYWPAKPAVQRAIDRAAELCGEAGVPLAAAALQFSMRDPRVHSTVVGVSERARLDDSLAWAAQPIPDGLWAELDEIVPGLEHAVDAGEVV